MSHWLDTVIDLLTADTKDLRELAKIAGCDPRTFYKGIDASSLDLEGQELDDIEFSDDSNLIEQLISGRVIALPYEESNLIIEVETLASAIRHIRRQEERVALLLRLVIDHRSLALDILEYYGQDKAKSARAALFELTRALREEKMQRSFFDFGGPFFDLDPPKTPPTQRKTLSNEVLAAIVSRPYSNNLPGTRSHLLYYMTKYLSDVPKVNATLASKVANAKSIFISPEQISDMRRFLKDPPEIDWARILGVRPQF